MPPFNNNMFGNQQSMRPNFMGGMRGPNPGASPVFPGLMARSRAAQGYLANQQQGIAQQLNRPLQRTADTAMGIQRPLPAGQVPSGVNPGALRPRSDITMINPDAARNVLAGQPMDLDRTMRPLNIPGMHLEGNRMVKDAPVPVGGPNIPNRGLGGMTPDQFRGYQEIARGKSGSAGLAAAQADGYGADGEENAGIGILNRQAQIIKLNPQNVSSGLNSSYANRKMASMARRNGFGSVSSFKNFMNQYNARQNRGTTPQVVPATGGAMQGIGRPPNQSPVNNTLPVLKDQPGVLRRQIPDETYNGFKGMWNWGTNQLQNYRRYQENNGGYIPG